jgi:hypothetical protein
MPSRQIVKKVAARPVAGSETSDRDGPDLRPDNRAGRWILRPVYSRGAPDFAVEGVALRQSTEQVC